MVGGVIMIDKRKDFVCPHCGYWKYFDFSYNSSAELYGSLSNIRCFTELKICRKCGTVFVPQKILREMNDNAEIKETMARQREFSD